MLSFIIPAHNEEAYLNKTINTIHQSTIGISENYEILVVDDASTDNTKAVGEAAGAVVVRQGRVDGVGIVLRAVESRRLAAAWCAGDPKVNSNTHNKNK